MTGSFQDPNDAVSALLGDSELVVISNRQPYKHSYADAADGDEDDDQPGPGGNVGSGADRRIEVDAPAGGLTAGLDPVVQRAEGTWIAWGAGEADDEVTDDDGCVAMPPDDPRYTLKLVDLTEEEVRSYYYGYSNRVLWPLCHGGIWQTEFAGRYWDQYRDVNRKFAEAVIECAEDDDPVVWFQDYHLTRAPQHVRAALPEAFLMHFWHITWPGWDTFRSSPHKEKLLSGLLGNDLLGFHTVRYCRNFLDCVEGALDDVTVDRDRAEVRYHDGRTVVRPFPLGVDADAIEESSRSVDRDRWRDIAREYDIPTSGRIALGVDRLDYTKGIPQRLDALEQFWETRPEWQEHLTYVQKATESRSLIPNYQNLQDRVAESIERINDRFGTDDWQPVVYVDEMLPREELMGLYRHSDVMIVSAVRDGMNLVAKEYVAANVDADGALVLSNQTGAYEQLGEHAVTINPHETETFADGIEEALTMDDRERRRRMERLRETVASADIDAWMTDVFETAESVRAEPELTDV